MRATDITRPVRPAFIRQAAIVFAICFVLTALVYRKAPTSFLRAESGYYLSVSHSPEAGQQHFKRWLFTHSYGGHYTPLIFLAEFQTAKWVGTWRDFWRWRQIIAVAIAGAASFGALVAVTKTMGVGFPQSSSIAAALTALALFQPAMVDFVSWPFMIMQLLWLGLLMLALYSVIRITDSPADPRWPWIAAATAYGSMHVSGLGVVTVAGVAAVLLTMWVARFGRSRHLRSEIGRALLGLCCFAAAHACAMAFLLTKSAASHTKPSVHSIAAVKLVVGFVFNFACAGVRTFFLTSPSAPSTLAIAYCWPLGLLLIVCVLLVFRRIPSVMRAELPSPRVSASAVFVFSVAGFFALILLMTARQIAEAPSTVGIVPFFNAFTVLPRYIIPLQFLLLGPAGILLTRVAKPQRATIIACSVVVFAAMITQIEFQRGPMKSLMPANRTSHYTAWRLLLATARECRAANVPMPNLPLTELTEKLWNSDVQSFLPLLRADLGLKVEDQLELVAWPLPAEERNQRYAAVPSLQELEQKLGLTPPRVSD